jgi:glycerol-3-phosphate dehydrogenase
MTTHQAIKNPSAITANLDADLLIIGGGINGAGIAADAAGRGLSVILVEQGDFAQATSSASSKLIHGGLRYLEHYEFRLVREALAEREVMLNKAPHLVTPMRFSLPHRPHLRPAWMIRTGLFLYDRLGGPSRLLKSNPVHFDPIDSDLKPEITEGFEYTDCWVDDARLVICNLQQAKENGAQVFNYTQCLTAKPIENGWEAVVENRQTKQKRTVSAKVIVNATGPWAQKFIEGSLTEKSPKKVNLIKGSHIIIPRVLHSPNSYILQNEDKRVVFAIPYLQDYTLIGTTDKRYDGDPAQVAIDQTEIDYLVQVFNDHFKAAIQASDVLFHYSGIRPLCDDESDDPSAMTRDYTLTLSNHGQSQSKLLSIFGGKITTYRKLSEAALTKLQVCFPAMGPSWTANTPLPGGHLNPQQLDQKLSQDYPWVPTTLLDRWMTTYGDHTFKFLNHCRRLEDLGIYFGGSLYERELNHLIQQEFAQETDDVLYRRTKLGWIYPQKPSTDSDLNNNIDIEKVQDYIKAHQPVE